MDVDVEKFWQDGFIVLRDALTHGTISRWRSAALDAERGQDLLSNDVLAEVICDDTLLGTARKILGGTPVYFGDSTVMRGTSAGIGFHKDNSDRYDQNAPDWKVDRYPIIRFGIYTQSHGKLPFGLDVRLGSHNHADVTTGKMLNLDVEPGDLIVWNGRTTHSGNSKIFKVMGNRMAPDPTRLSVRLVNKLGGLPWIFAGHPQERVALFASYGLSSPSLDRHLEYLCQRDYAVKMWKTSHWSAYARKMVERSDLELVDVTSNEHDGRQLYSYYHALPY